MDTFCGSEPEWMEMDYFLADKANGICFGLEIQSLQND